MKILGANLTVYIAGPMTGLPELNYPAFHSAAKALREKGWQVKNPAEILKHSDWTWNDCLRADIRSLVLCQGVAYLPGHEASKGARLEIHIARELGMVVKPVEWWLDDGQWV